MVRLEKAFDLDKQEKQEAYYGPMMWATYPFVHSLALDLQNNSLKGFDDSYRSYLKIPDPIIDTEIKKGSLQELTNSLNIPIFQAPKKQHFTTLHGTHFTFASNEKNLQLYNSLFSILGRRLYQIIWESRYSLTGKVYDSLSLNNDKVNDLYVQSPATRSTVDGFFSTFENAVHLHQSYTASDKDNFESFMEILRSNLMAEDTPIYRVSTLTLLGEEGIFPVNGISKTNRGDLKITRDIARFLRYVNTRHSFQFSPPMVCPMAMPLGVEGFNKTMEFYKNLLPAPVITSMQESVDVPAITISGRAMADFFSSL